MDLQVPRHEKIRFRRDEITDLGAFPSASGLDPRLWRRSRWSRLKVAAAGAAAVAAILCVALVLVGYGVAVLGFGSGALREKAEAALADIVGPAYRASAGSARIAFDGFRLLALEVSDVRVAALAGGTSPFEAEQARFGVRLLPLFAGEVRLSDASLEGARIALPLMATDPLAALRDPHGLLDPDRVAPLLFGQLDRLVAEAEKGGMQRLALNDVTFALPHSLAPLQALAIRSAELSAAAGAWNVAVDAELDGRPVTAQGTLTPESASGRAADLALTLASPAPEGETPNATGVGAVTLSLTGSATRSGAPASLAFSLAVEDGALDMGNRGVLTGDIAFEGRIVEGANKIDVRRLSARAGDSAYRFYGSIGPRPQTEEAGDQPAYRFDLISPDTTIMPEGSPEQALETYLRLTGVYLPEERRLSADEIQIKSGPGEVLGTASLRFEPGKTPGVSLAAAVRDVPVAGVKQLWPWLAARGARSWVMEKVFGGRVVEGRLRYSVEPGFIGSGRRVTAEQVSGSFTIEDTRFDTAGTIPPVRDADGTVEFRGDDVDITLASGTAYLPSGRTVAASKGSLAIRNAVVPPVLGRLEIDVAGDAAAIAELASNDPIDAMRFIPWAAEDFSGSVSGHVSADIPLQKGIDRDSLDWLVSLSYEGLALAKPVDGQQVTDAKGTIVINPAEARIAAAAKLNGVDAKIEALEPFQRSTERRRRVVEMTLSRADRDRLFPALAELVDGPVSVRAESLKDGRQKIEADLGKATLSLPWTGWTKGSGIPGKVAFTLAHDGEAVQLGDFRLSGDSFGATGTLTLRGGALDQAKFSSLRLNRGDDVAVTVRRTGSRYAVDMRGHSFDARGAVDRYMSSTAKDGADGAALTIKAAVDALTGFNGERLGNVTLEYADGGGRASNLEVVAYSAAGKPMRMSNKATAEGRQLRMQSGDAGAVLRFMNIYPRMEGGTISLALDGAAKGPMRGQIDASDFWIVDEPRLASLVSSRPAGQNMSLNEAVRRDIDTKRVKFERGNARLETDTGHLKIASGVLRGPLIGSTFQGTFYDKAGNMDMTGTFMPAYGLNRLFAEIPVLGMFLGNGRDRGLIGITFRLSGKASDPQITVNPLSVIAPGIFRTIFEFR